MKKWDSKNFEFYVLTPNSDDIMSFSTCYFPFSWAYFTQCYFRLKERKNHETLDMEKNSKAYLYLLLVLNLFKNTYLEENLKYKYFKFSFADENGLDIDCLDTSAIDNIFRMIGTCSFSTGRINLN